MAKDTKKPETKDAQKPPEKQEGAQASATARMEALAYSSPQAASLVQLVPEPDRLPMLGDILSAVQAFVGEGHNPEAAEDVVRRLGDEVKQLREKVAILSREATQADERAAAAAGEVSALKAAMSARRAPQSSVVGRFSFMRQQLEEAGEKVGEFRSEEAALADVLRERKSLREALGSLKTGQVAVLRDDSSEGVSERYTLLLGEVRDGALFLHETVGGSRAAWVDIRPIVEAQVVPFLTPVGHGGRR